MHCRGRGFVTLIEIERMKSVRILILMSWIMANVLPGVAIASDARQDSTLQWNWHAQPVEGNPGQIDLVLEASIQPGWILYSSDFETVDFGPRSAQIMVE